MPSDINQLQQWMQFYDQSGAGGPRTGGEGMNAPNYAGQRLNFALRMMQQGQGQGQGVQQMPNYFQGNMPAYTPPTATAPNPFPAINGGKPQGPPPQYQNFLQQLFNRQPQQYPASGFRG